MVPFMQNTPYPTTILAEGVQFIISNQIRLEILLPKTDALELIIRIT